MNLDLIQDLPMLKFPSPIKIPSNNTNRDDDGSSGGCTTPTSSDHKIPPSTATTPPPPPQKRRPPPSPSCFIRSCKRKLLTPSKVEIIVNKDEIERFFSSVYNHSTTSSPTTTTTKKALAVVRRRRSFRSCSRRWSIIGVNHNKVKGSFISVTFYLFYVTILNFTRRPTL